MELLHSNIWWHVGLELIGNDFSYARAHELIYKGIQCVDYIWNSEDWIFFPWDEILTLPQLRSMIGSRLWPTINLVHLMDKDPDIKLPGQCIKLYRDKRQTWLRNAMLNHLRYVMHASLYFSMPLQLNAPR